MPRWSFAVPLEPSGGAPLFRQIARAVVEDIERGRLRPGDRLPGTRHLARSLRLNRNTVVAAYSELRAEGWTTAATASGTFVSRVLPDRKPRAFVRGAAVPGAAEVGFDVPPVPSGAPAATDRAALPHGTLALLAGSPDVRIVPVEALARAYRSAIRAPGRRALAYGDPRGHPRLRSALAAMLSATRGLAAVPESVLVTRGSQMALGLIARALVRPGDVVAVEELGYRPAFDVFRLAGARLLPIPLDGDGMRVDALEQHVAEGRLRAVYLTPHHQYPTTATLSPARRRRLLDLARGARVAIVEDDYDHEFQYEGRPILPLASADAAGTVVYVGTLSKVLAPGLRIG
jgi:GntR family transcriptional regulator / MocR family aminotransferase